MFSQMYDRQYQALSHLSSEQYPPRGSVRIRNLGIQKALGALGFCSRAMRGAPRREFEAVEPPRTARSHGPRRLRRLAVRDSLCSSVASLPVVSSRGAAARAGRGTAGPSRLASPGERRSPELAAHSAANVRVRRERLALSVRQDSVDCPAETD